MSRRLTVGVLLLMAALGPGCGGDDEPATTEESDDARVLCEREAETNEPPLGVRGVLVGAIETTIEAVNSEITREYANSGRKPELASEPEDEPLALCYYDVPGDQPQREPKIERVGIVVDQKLNSLLLYAGPKDGVPVRGIG